MKISSNRWTLVCLGIAAMAAPAAFAQQQQSSAPDQYQGVSQPPSDDTIVAAPDTPPSAAKVKPSPAVSVPPPSASSPVASQPPAPAPAPSPASTDNDSQYDNTDYGIVTVPAGQSMDTTSTPSDTATLHTRSSDNPDDDIVHVSVPANELQAGTEIRVRMSEELSTGSTAEGSPFEGRVMMDVLKEGSVIIPSGSTLKGRVVYVSQGHHLGPAATLRLRPDVVILPDGTAYHLHAQVMSSWAEGTRTGSEGAIQPSVHVVKNSVEYGVGVGTGALVGGELAGPAGVLAGSLVGAGLVTTHILLQHPQAAVVPAGSEIIFSLTEPLDLTPTRN